MKRNVPTPKGYRPFESMWQFLVLLLCLGTCLFAADIWSMLRGMDSQWANLCDTVSKAYQHGTPGNFRSAIEMLEKGMGVHIFLIDEDGHDRTSGEDKSQLLSSRRNPGLQLPGPPPPRAVSTASGTCVIVEPRRNPTGIPPGLWFLLFLAFACCSVAGYVALRIRHIETAVAQFGSGSMGVRIDTRSTDSMGRLARTFNQMADKIESLLEGNRRLCIDISHELRSPLTRLRLAAGLARSGSVGALQCMETEILRLDELVNTLLDTARAEADADTLHAEPVSVQSLLMDITEGCSIEANDRCCGFNIKVVEAVSVKGDPELLRSALENIVRNAIRHSPAGALIDIHAARIADGTTQVSIRDYGTGVPISSLERIFQPFYRVESDRNRSTGGTGLGLAIAKRIITVHGGSVKAENSNPGLRVAVSFPRS